MERLTANPAFRVEWEDFDTAVGKVFYLVEAKVGDRNYWPIFRSTPWLTLDHAELKGVVQSKPGTTGHLEFADPLGDVLARATEARSDPQRVGTKEWENLPLPRPLTVADASGRPDYRGFFEQHDTNTSYEGYVGGNSIGNAPERILDEGYTLANHFPGAASGAYGPAADAGPASETDGEWETTEVSLRYTVELLTVDASYLKRGLGYDGVDDAAFGEGHLEDVRRGDVRSAGLGDKSVLVMDGEDGYPTVAHREHGRASQDYGELRAASSHPGTLVDESTSEVAIKNQAANARGSGSSNTGIR